MKRFFYTIAVFAVAFALLSCAPESNGLERKFYTCDFEGEVWDALVDSSVNGDNLLNGTIAPSWHDEASDLAGEVSQPFPGYWEGVALSNHCSRDCEANGSPRVCRSRLAIHRGIPRLGYHVAIFGSLISGIELTIEVHSVNFRLQFDSQVAGGEILGHIVDAVGKRHTVNQLVHDLLDHRSRNISHKGKSKHEKHTGIAL